jgi:hypothetical protein
MGQVTWDLMTDLPERRNHLASERANPKIGAGC